MVKRVEEVDKEAFADLVSNIRRAETLANKALSDLQNGEYQKIAEYSGQFNDGRQQFKANNYDYFMTEMEAVFLEFSAWISEWEIK
jgi:hypothetical protein